LFDFTGRKGPWARALFQVAPPTGLIEWPPAGSFTRDEDLDELSARFTMDPPPP
jgi:hypothetical protein